MVDVNQLAATAEKWGATPEPLVEAGILPPDWADSEDPEVRIAWRIENRGSADWALKRLAECESEVAAIDAQARAAIERIEKRRAELAERTRRGVEFFKFRLAEWAQRERGTLLPGKKKSVDFLHGRIGWRAAGGLGKGGKLVVKDPAALTRWLETQPADCGLYRVEIKPDMKALQEAFKADGVIPPGCEADPGSETFYVEPQLPEGPALTGKE